ncbi:hypothetical protein Bsp3421_001451 [Burkholderia sp. FERM BP-3421]|uniref:hypothetical protein n=1 Tax=Burkholderia sp. FERM BP-3421 TaxID=1494466 RepID=UPI002095EAC5|nr:hypothetical protein [Burkholderia sp. FERM BP-3421]WDD91523.1 hypothetical protein Bsp3421_001451 [Burkholderia sp. FERM BP-3421]
MFSSFAPTATGFVTEIEGCRCSIEGAPSPIADRIDWLWTIAQPELDNLDGSDPFKYETLATGETVTPLQAAQQIVAWLDAHPPE